MTDVSEPLKTGTNEEQVSVQSINVLPKDFTEDDAVPSIFLEDLEGDKEVWLLECPAMLDPCKLLGKQLHFSHQTSFKLDEVSKENCTAVPLKEDSTDCYLLSSCTGHTVKAVGLKHAGKIKLNVSLDVPNLGSMIPDGTSVLLPGGLKMRHPFLGPRYHDIVESMQNVKKNISEDEGIERKLSRKKKRKSIDAGISHNICSEEIGNTLDPYKTNSSVSDEVGYFSPKQVKKKKLKSHHTGDPVDHGELQDEAEETSKEIKQTLKKTRKEKHYANVTDINALGLDQSYIQEPELESEYSVSKKRKRESEIENEILINQKNSKKQIQESTFKDIYGADSQEMPVTIDHFHVSKKIKKEKRCMDELSDNFQNNAMDGLESLGGGEAVFASPKKKKNHSLLNTNYIGTSVHQGESSVNSSDGKQSPNNTVKDKKRTSFTKDGNLNKNSEKVDLVYDSGDHIAKMVKKDKKEHLVLNSEYVNSKGLQDNLNIPHSGNDEIPKKSKKKKKGTHYQDNDTNSGDSQEVLEVVHESSGHSSKMTKERKHEISAPVELTPEEENYGMQEVLNKERKRAKKKKRHAMDNSELDNVSTVQERLGSISEEEANVVPSGSGKKRSGLFSGNEMLLLSPKKEKIKLEPLEFEMLDTPKEKRKKEKRK